MSTETRVEALIKIIQTGSILCGLDLTVTGNQIAFVDQREGKLVSFWTPEYTLSDKLGKEGENEGVSH